MFFLNDAERSKRPISKNALNMGLKVEIFEYKSSNFINEFLKIDKETNIEIRANFAGSVYRLALISIFVSLSIFRNSLIKLLLLHQKISAF